MSQDFRESILLITSADNKPDDDFGTGFIIHQDKQTVFVLTCSHVVQNICKEIKVGDISEVRIDNHPAKLIALGDRFGCDLAVLSVENRLTERCVLKLGKTDENNSEKFVTHGMYKDIINSHQAGDATGFVISKTGSRRANGIITPLWQLRVSDDSPHPVVKGYSGSPLIDESTKYVLAIIVELTNIPNEARAIPIEVLSKIWKDMPLDLINENKNENNSKIPISSILLEPPTKRKRIWKVIICIAIMIILAIIITNELQKQRAEKIAIAQEAVFNEANNEINSEDEKIRISGIEKMEKIFNDSKEKQWTIVRALARSITTKHPAPKPLNRINNQTKPAEDTNKSLSIIKKPKVENGKKLNEIITLKESNFYDVDLSEAQLPNVDFNRSYLYQSNLSNANLKNAHFNGAYLRGASLKEADLTEADLEGADLLKANLEGANLFKVNLEGANFTDEQIKQACNWNLARYDEKAKLRLKPDNTKKVESCS
jgi:Pentapeptide repeats (8 copies)/Trypsin-like peptidase domain